MNNVYKKLFELKKLTGKVVKGASNPFFKTKYSDLNSVIDATESALEEVGLLYLDRVEGLELISDIIDIESGEVITTKTPLLLAKQDMQQLGSAITYARRYARMTTLGLQSVDDDGGVASGTVFIRPKQIKEINELILATKTDTVKFLQYFHTDAVKNLTEQAAIQAIKTLTLKKEKGAKDGTDKTN